MAYTPQNSKRKKKILAKRAKSGHHIHELLLFKSNQYIYGAVLNKESGKTLLSYSTLQLKNSNNITTTEADAKVSRMRKARLAGSELAKMCKDKNLSPVINTANYRYHGIIKEFVEAFNNSTSGQENDIRN